MANFNISNIKEIDKSYNSVSGNVTRVTQALRNDYNDLISGNVYYKKVSSKNIATAIICDLLFAFLLFSREQLLYKLYTFVGDDITLNYQAISTFLFWLFLILLIYNLYQTGIIVYCKRLEGYSSRIDKVEKKANDRVSSLASENMLNTVKNKALANTDYTIESKNDLGKEIFSIKENLKSTNQMAHNIKKIISFVVAIGMFISLIVYMKTQFVPSIEEHSTIGFVVFMLFIIATAVVNISQFLLGEYLGKFTKIVGFVMTAIYGLLLYGTLKGSYAYAAFAGMQEGAISKFNLISVIIPLVQILGMILTICLSHYGLEKEKWTKGFQVAMGYGSKTNGNKFTLLFRGTLSFILALALCMTLAVESPTGAGIWSYIICAVLWYAANTLMKPRGSYLYTFWGRGRSIANEVVLVGALFTSILLTRGTIMLEELVTLGIIFVLSFVIAGVAKFVNNII